MATQKGDAPVREMGTAARVKNILGLGEHIRGKECRIVESHANHSPTLYTVRIEGQFGLSALYETEIEDL